MARYARPITKERDNDKKWKTGKVLKGLQEAENGGNKTIPRRGQCRNAKG